MAFFGRLLLSVGVVALAAFLSPVQAEDFYKDKTVRFIVGYSPGGSFDLYTRVIARHFPKHVPGQPTTVVENMTGAGGIIAANHLYNRAAPDGLTIGAWAAPLLLQQIMGNDAVKFDGRKFGYLGVPSPYDTVCTFNERSGIASVQDWFAAKRPVKISSIGPGTSTSDIPKLLKAALNLPLEVVEGYKGGADARLAVESGEVDGYCGSWQTVETVWRAAFESGKIRPVLQATLESHPRYKHVPLAATFAKSDLARQLITVADSAHGAQFPYSVPPGAPKERLELLQKAFVDTLKDPEFLAEAKKSKLDIDVIDGPTITKKFAQLYELQPAVIAKLREVLLPKK
ncbi:MAG TPA: tripartite tricarboxylate transporter substrate-binding protein [Candidatus Acidoferrales bacterium]|nr:tripartite tricarboxylate transporter substrate-binding protein [Candidatus Acidoferrales bacterium]